MIKAIIFDMDGVISDTNMMHAKIEEEIFKKNGIIIKPEELIKRFAGYKFVDIVKILGQEHEKKLDINRIVRLKKRKVFEVTKKELKPIKGAIPLIKKSYKNHELAVASASHKKYVHYTLKKLGVKKYFKAIITGDDVKHAKPNPEIFLLAAKKMNIPPKYCLVIEDGKAGMIAAKRAKMKCVGLVKNKDSKEYPADVLVEKLSRINPEKIKKL